MGAFLRVKVPQSVGHDERSEAQLHEGDRVWDRQAWSVNCKPMDKSRIEGDTQQGEQAIICKDLMTKGDVA